MGGGADTAISFILVGARRGQRLRQGALHAHVQPRSELVPIGDSPMVRSRGTLTAPVMDPQSVSSPVPRHGEARAAALRRLDGEPRAGVQDLVLERAHGQLSLPEAGRFGPNAGGFDAHASFDHDARLGVLLDCRRSKSRLHHGVLASRKSPLLRQ